MRVERVRVAEGVELAVDRWEPADGTTGPSSSAAGESTVGAHDRTAPFLLVHGLASNARLWDGVATELMAAGHPVAAVDLRGHGRSSKPDGPYDVPTVAADLAGLVAGLGLDRPIVAGQSWGGNVVLELAAGQPQLVRGIACVDGGWLEPSRAFPDWAACLQALAPPRLAGRPFAEIEAHVRAAHPDWPDAGIAGALANFEVRPDGTVAPWLTYDRHVAILRGLWEHHPSALYPRVAPPVLLLPVATADAASTGRKRRDVAAGAAALPNARVEWFTGDHDIHAQHPAEVARVLARLADEGFYA